MRGLTNLDTADLVEQIWVMTENRPDSMSYATLQKPCAD